LVFFLFFVFFVGVGGGGGGGGGGGIVITDPPPMPLFYLSFQNKIQTLLNWLDNINFCSSTHLNGTIHINMWQNRIFQLCY